jgi:uncharacterized protein
MTKFLPLFCIFAAVSGPAVSAPAMWEVRDDDSRIVLFGSFHMLPEGVEWRTPLFDDMLAEADRVVFETDIRPEAAAQIGALGLAKGIYTDGTLLSSVIDDDLEESVRALAEAYGIPIGSLLAMKPWLAANTISVAALTMTGYTAQGVETSLQSELTDDRLGELETGEEQVEVLAGLSEADQIDLLATSIDELPKLAKMMEKLVDSWLAGTTEQMAERFVEEMGGDQNALIERVLYTRNENWVSPLSAMLAGNQDALVIVGAAHLIGERSVLELLEAEGFEIERVQ